MVIRSQVVMPVRLALASTTWKLGWGIFDRRNGKFSTGLDTADDWHATRFARGRFRLSRVRSVS
jgi:hypothetical protein